MGPSISILTAALLVGQTTGPDANGKTCACKNGAQGRVSAQPGFVTETQSSTAWTWRGATTTETFRSTTSEPSWIDNRPVLSKVKSWFGRGDNGVTRTESTQTFNGAPAPVFGQQATVTSDSFRRQPTTNEPPLANVIQPASVQPSRAAPPAQRPAPFVPSATEPPLSIEIEPIEFRPAGQAKGIAPSLTVPLAKAPELLKVSEVSASTVARPSRPNPINPRFADKVGQPGDYSWITGQLEIRGGTYVLHYASPETIDRHNGSVVLATDADLRNFRNGDLVSAHGIVVQQSGRATTYRAQTVDLIER